MADGHQPQHWRLSVDDANRAWLHLDQQDTGTNVLSSEVIEELDHRLTEVCDLAPIGLVILSDKPNGFIAGADISAFKSIREPQQAEALIQRAQAVFDRLENLPFPSVARITGFCLGGGLELALACTYRVALDEAHTRLGLPEVLLGIHPGFGGSGRLTRLIGAPVAMSLMLSGRTLDARSAHGLGIVDRRVPRRQLDRAVVDLLTNSPQPAKPASWTRLTNHNSIRPTLAWYLRRQVEKRAAPEHYPAPYALIDLWRTHGDDPRKMIAAEAASVAKLVTGATAQNLVRAFFLRERLKATGRTSEFNARHVHVIGAGAMGGDIAAWCALKGCKVTLQDRAAEYIAPALKRAQGLFTKRVKDRRLRQATLDRLIPDQEGHGIAHADLVIEVIIEDLEAKQCLYKTLEPRLKPGALLATNTSSIPLEQLGEALAKPGRLVGIHFFNPVARMQLVEVIAGNNTDADAIDQATAFVRAIDRLPLAVKSSPGFLVNRVLMPYLQEAVHLVEDGVSPQAIDRAAVNFGMPMGPIQLADTVGLDICLSVGEILAASQGSAVPERLRTLVAQGHLGRKSGQGFYTYRNGKPKRRWLPQKSATDPEVTDRLVLCLINEAVACLREGLVGDADLLDGGMIFGTGFAPFRGGPMHYVTSQGAEVLRERLNQLAQKHGPRFTPDAGWETL